MSFATRRPKIGLECRPTLMCRAPSSSSLTVRWWQGGTAARAGTHRREPCPRRFDQDSRADGRTGSAGCGVPARPGGFEPWACRRRRSQATMVTAPPGAPARPEASASCGPATTSLGSPRCLLAEAPDRITPVPLVPTHQVLVPQSKMWLTPQLSHNRIDGYSLARRKAKHTDVAWKKEHGAVHEATAEPIDWWRPSVRQLGRV